MEKQNKGNNMKVAIVSFGQIIQANRMDPAFHITNKKHEESVKILRKKYGNEEAFDHAKSILDLMPRAYQIALEPLSISNSSKHPAKEALEKAIEKYPHLALSILLEQKSIVLKSEKSRIAKEEEALKALQTRFKNVEG